MKDVSIIGRSSVKLVLGLGLTGLSVASYLTNHGFAFRVADTRVSPPNLQKFQAQWPEVPLHLGSIPIHWFDEVDELIVSPGLSADHPDLQAAREQGLSVIGDVSLFLRVCTAPIIAVTGTNGKTTVVDLLGKVAEHLGFKCGMLGNMGRPVLDAVDHAFDLVVLELSSFQLELIENLNARVAVLLNVSPDHMDRYANLEAYWQAKQRIFQGAQSVVINRQDPLTVPVNSQPRKASAFTLGPPSAQEFGVLQQADQCYIAMGVKPLVAVRDIKLAGRHNWANLMACLGVAKLMDWPLEQVIGFMRSYSGLAHRCQWVGQFAGVDWYNDSKGTNAGAAIAAIEGFAPRALFWIGGGRAKGCAFDALAERVRDHVAYAFIYGEAKSQIAASLDHLGYSNYQVADDLRACVVAAAAKAKVDARAGGLVLFSPACASFDQFDGFEHRGNVFMDLVFAQDKD